MVNIVSLVSSETAEPACSTPRRGITVEDGRSSTACSPAVEEDEDGGYYVEEAAFSDINTTQEGVTVTAEDLTLGGISIPANPSADPTDRSIFPDTITISMPTARMAVTDIWVIRFDRFLEVRKVLFGVAQ